MATAFSTSGRTPGTARCHDLAGCHALGSGPCTCADGQVQPRSRVHKILRTDYHRHPDSMQNSLVVGGRAGVTERDEFWPTIVKNLAQNNPSRFAPNPFASFAMKAKHILPPKTSSRRSRRRSGMSQKEERDAIDAAFKRLIGDDGFKPQGVFGTRKPT
jgi:hypothetical protein